jgi:hypothetical protein
MQCAKPITVTNVFFPYISFITYSVPLSCFSTVMVLWPKYTWITFLCITSNSETSLILLNNLILSSICISSNKEWLSLESAYNKYDSCNNIFSSLLLSAGHSLFVLISNENVYINSMQKQSMWYIIRKEITTTVPACDLNIHFSIVHHDGSTPHFQWHAMDYLITVKQIAVSAREDHTPGQQEPLI